MKIIKNCMALAMITLTLSGCSVYREEFSECGADKGIPCKTLSEVHQLVNEQQSMNTPVAPVIGEMSGNHINHEEVVLSDKSVIQRAREEHLRVWLAPFQDDQGNFHEASVVYSVIRPSFWQIQTINWG